jgi:hypothetical protein
MFWLSWVWGPAATPRGVSRQPAVAPHAEGIIRPGNVKQALVDAEDLAFLSPASPSN